MKQKILILSLLVFSVFQEIPVMAQTTILAPTSCSEQVAPCADVIDYQYKVVDGVLYKRLYNYTLNKPLSDWVIAT